MFGRPKRIRTVRYNPEITYFKPLGIPFSHLAEENLTLDEVESVRLHDLEGLEQETASKKMDVSRVTFLRILHSAHKKVAKALIYGRALSLKGGDYVMPNKIKRGFVPGIGRGFSPQGATMECVCPNCNTKAPHTRGVPCFTIKCPKCGSQMAGTFCKP